MLGLVVCGLRTWMCTMAAPALAASIAEWAICSGVTGTAGLRPGVSAEPVTAHEMITLRCMLPPNRLAPRGGGRSRRSAGSSVPCSRPEQHYRVGMLKVEAKKANDHE